MCMNFEDCHTPQMLTREFPSISLRSCRRVPKQAPISPIYSPPLVDIVDFHASHIPKHHDFSETRSSSDFEEHGRRSCVARWTVLLAFEVPYPLSEFGPLCARDPRSSFRSGQADYFMQMKLLRPSDHRYPSQNIQRIHQLVIVDYICREMVSTSSFGHVKSLFPPTSKPQVQTCFCFLRSPTTTTHHALLCVSSSPTS
jgi:hypothetical protein